jgi:hypothetical protein
MTRSAAARFAWRRCVAAVCLLALGAGAVGCRGCGKEATPDPAAPEHRAKAEACPARQRRPGVPDPKRKGCHSDSECPGKNARCERIGIDATNTCSADDCTTDHDCMGNDWLSPEAKAMQDALTRRQQDCAAKGWPLPDCADLGPRPDESAKAACVCGTGDWQTNKCVFGDCVTDADCPDGKYCSLSDDEFCRHRGYFCHRNEDECRSSIDCGGRGPCAFDDKKKHWRCMRPCPVR